MSCFINICIIPIFYSNISRQIIVSIGKGRYGINIDTSLGKDYMLDAAMIVAIEFAPALGVEVSNFDKSIVEVRSYITGLVQREFERVRSLNQRFVEVLLSSDY